MSNAIIADLRVYRASPKVSRHSASREAYGVLNSGTEHLNASSVDTSDDCNHPYKVVKKDGVLEESALYWLR